MSPVVPKTITDVAAEAAVSSDALRYYEKLGLVAPVGRTSAGYRLYDDGIVERVRLIKGAQRSGLRLADVKELLEIHDQGGCPCGHTQKLVARRLAEVDAEIDRLVSLRKQLAELSRIAGTCRDPSGWPCRPAFLAKGGEPDDFVP